MKLIGIVLIVLGVIGLVAGGISWTEREKVVDLGPLEVTTENRESISAGSYSSGTNPSSRLRSP